VKEGAGLGGGLGGGTEGWFRRRRQRAVPWRGCGGGGGGGWGVPCDRDGCRAGGGPGEGGTARDDGGRRKAEVPFFYCY